MKQNINFILIFSIAFFTWENTIHGQNPSHRSGPEFAIVGQHPFLNCYENKTFGYVSNISLYHIGIETSWQSKNSVNTHYALNLLYGTYFIRYFNENNNYNQASFEIAFSSFFGPKNHFYELGAGTDSEGLIKLIIGYRTYVWQNLILKMQFLPTSYAFSGGDGMGLLDFGIGAGYRINNNPARHIGNGINFFGRRSYLGLEALLIPVERSEAGPVPDMFLNYGFMPIVSNNFRLLFSAGAGFESGGGSIYQTGVSAIWGEHIHLFETGINFIYALLRNPNYIYKYSDYVLPQIQIGYRHQFTNDRWFAKVAFAPYIRVLNWNPEGGLLNNVVFGFGYKLAKEKI